MRPDAKRRGLEQAVSRAFITAHLLTASPEESESAVLNAIDSFNLDIRMQSMSRFSALVVKRRRAKKSKRTNSKLF